MLSIITKGQRPKIRNSWPSEFSNLLEACWDKDSKKRPSFDVVIKILQKLTKHRSLF